MQWHFLVRTIFWTNRSTLPSLNILELVTSGSICHENTFLYNDWCSSGVSGNHLYLSVGESLQEDKDSGGLLLLCVWTDPTQGRPCPLLCGDGTGHDWHDCVSHTDTHIHKYMYVESLNTGLSCSPSLLLCLSECCCRSSLSQRTGAAIHTHLLVFICACMCVCACVLYILPLAS